MLFDPIPIMLHVYLNSGIFEWLRKGLIFERTATHVRKDGRVPQHGRLSEERNQSVKMWIPAHQTSHGINLIDMKVITIQ